MDIAAALQIVIDLASQNVADQLDHPEHSREQTADRNQHQADMPVPSVFD